MQSRYWDRTQMEPSVSGAVSGKFFCSVSFFHKPRAVFNAPPEPLCLSSIALIIAHLF